MSDVVVRVSKIAFHKTRITKAMRPVVRNALYKMSAFVQRRMKSSIKYRVNRAPSPVGSPPISHDKGKPNLRTILFDVDMKTESSVIGPVVFNQRKSDKPAPQTLEFGGLTTMKPDDGKPRRIRVRPRPFAEPSLRAEISKFPELLKG